MGVVSGIVMAFQFGTNWSVLARRPARSRASARLRGVHGVLLEATSSASCCWGAACAPGFYLLACCMVTLGTMASSFWILANNSWMQVPVGHEIVDGEIIPADWREIVLGR